MEQRKKIDTTLKERHGIIHLLDKLKSDDITLDQIEDIGTKLQKSGRRALVPLVRKLWRERSSDLISRYAYLLDFFDDQTWIDQLIQIALKREDLEEEGKAVLLAALKGYGVDITSPPFDRLLAAVGTSLEHNVGRLLDMQEEGLALFLEDFLGNCPEAQQVIIHELGSMSDPRALILLEVLLWFDEPEIVVQTINILARIRSPRAAEILRVFLIQGDQNFRVHTEKALRRLSFIGINPENDTKVSTPFHAAWTSPIDGSGYRSLWISRWQGNGNLAALYVQIHEKVGIHAAWGSRSMTEIEHDNQLQEMVLEEGGVTISVEYALRLLRHAIDLNYRNVTYLPPEFYILRSAIFRGEDLAPVSYQPEFREYNPARRSAAAGHYVADSAALFDDDFFAGWFMTNHAVYDFADQWNGREKENRLGKVPGWEESLLEKFCTQLITPELDLIRNRLLFNADLMRRAGRERHLVEQTLAVATSLPSPPLSGHAHPFLRRLALESIHLAREALVEGYDPRQQESDDDDEWL